jgi:hypothetical protein
MLWFLLQKGRNLRRKNLPLAMATLDGYELWSILMGFITIKNGASHPMVHRDFNDNHKKRIRFLWMG